MQTQSQPLAAGEAGREGGRGDSRSRHHSHTPEDGDSFPRHVTRIPKDHYLEPERGTPRSGLRCQNYTDVIRICVSDDDPCHVRGSVSAYGGNYQVAVSLTDDQPLSPERIENAFFGAVQHVEQLIAKYGPEGNVPEVTITGRRGPGQTDQP